MSELDPILQAISSAYVEVKIQVDPEELKDMEHLKERLRSPNLATALYNAVALLNDLYKLQDDGYEIQVVKKHDVRRVKLPA